MTRLRQGSAGQAGATASPKTLTEDDVRRIVLTVLSKQRIGPIERIIITCVILLLVLLGVLIGSLTEMLWGGAWGGAS